MEGHQGEDAMLTVGDVIVCLERLAPTGLAADWDNVGLLLGERTAPVGRILTCLTVTPESTQEAIDRQAQFIVTHHPILFKAVRRLTSDTPEGRTLLALARAGIAVYSPHTALDNAIGGINDLLARQLGLTAIGPLRKRDGARQAKVVVFVPDSDLARVSDAMFSAGAGNIGAYSQCSFRLAGTGTFFGSDASNPTIGEKGRREEVSEWRLEVVCPERAVPAVVAAMRKAHSYEEPAFDVYPLLPQTAPAGEGRVGALPQPVALSEVAARVRSALKCGPVQVVGDVRRAVQRVAIVCGAGGELLGDAVRARADVLLSGEMRFHDYLAARAQGIGLVLPGHYATERLGVEMLADRLRVELPGVEVRVSEREGDPVTWA
jgi:dinuclear metal center YbgI/SA1388 family protein